MGSIFMISAIGKELTSLARCSDRLPTSPGRPRTSNANRSLVVHFGLAAYWAVLVGDFHHELIRVNQRLGRRYGNGTYIAYRQWAAVCAHEPLGPITLIMRLRVGTTQLFPMEVNSNNLILCQ